MKILGIETSCDETAICLIEVQSVPAGLSTGKSVKVLGNQLYSQVAKHKEWGGVMPTLAKREHQKNLVPLLEKCLTEAGMNQKNLESLSESMTVELQKILDREADLFVDFVKVIPGIMKPEIDAIAVTNGPGLEPALWVGVNFAKALSALWNIPVIPTNHMEGHIVVSGLDKVGLEGDEYDLLDYELPAVALLISGGHTQLVLIEEKQKYKIIGNTRDDAAGEAFDKVARILGLPYPGGPEISRLAAEERLNFPVPQKNYPLPRPMIHSKDLDFSFSGLKTAVLYTAQKIGAENLSADIKQEIAREFEDAVIDVLIKKTQRAALDNSARTLILGGGVVANAEVRKRFSTLASEISSKILIPEISASTDNALMIALAGYLKLENGQSTTTDFIANGNLAL